MNIYIPKALYQRMPTIWWGLCAASVLLGIFAPHPLEVLTGIVSLIQGTWVFIMREEFSLRRNRVIR